MATDGHRMNMFDSYNIVNLDWDEFKKENLIENLRRAVEEFNTRGCVMKKDWIGSTSHSLIAGRDNILKGKIPGFNPGDPFSKDYVPGKIEKWFFDRGIGPYKT